MTRSLSEIRSSLPADKAKSDPYWTRYVIRPVSQPVTWLAMRIGLSANQATAVFLGAGLAGSVLLASGDRALAFFGAALLNVAALLDAVDGNIARTTRSAEGPVGEWYDAVAGYAVHTGALLALGASAAWESGGRSPADGVGLLWLSLGVVAAVCNLFMRLSFQKARLLMGGEELAASGGDRSLWSAVDKNTALGGFVLPAILVAVPLGFTRVFVGSLAVLYFAGVFGLGIILSRRLKQT